MSNTLDTSLHKILIWMVKTIPIIMAISYVIDDILMYMGIDTVLINYFSGVSLTTLAFLYFASYALKFCPYHRVPLHYIVICNCISFYEYYIGFPIKSVDFLAFQLAVFMSFTLLYIYLKFKS